jgi:hypothetical protein
MESYAGQKADLAIIRRLKLGEDNYQNQSYGVLFAIPCKVGGMEFTHQGFIHETRGQFSVYASLSAPRPGRREGTMTPALRLFVAPLLADDVVDFAALWQEEGKDTHSVYFRGRTTTSPAKYLLAFKAKVRDEGEEDEEGQEGQDPMNGVEPELPTDFPADMPF